MSIFVVDMVIRVTPLGFGLGLKLRLRSKRTWHLIGRDAGIARLLGSVTSPHRTRSSASLAAIKTRGRALRWLDTTQALKPQAQLIKTLFLLLKGPKHRPLHSNSASAMRSYCQVHDSKGTYRLHRTSVRKRAISGRSALGWLSPR